jgi:hypothetical protein
MARVIAKLKNDLSFIPAANSKIMEYFYQYRSYKTDIHEYGEISGKDNTYCISPHLN